MRTNDLTRRTWRAALLAVCVVAGSTARAGAQPLSLHIPDETVAPGGVLQAKIDLTEPRPIQTGGGGMSFADYQDFLGLAVNSPNGDAAAVGVMRGATLRVRMVSPTSDIGSSGEYPILATTLKVPSTAVPGTQSPMTLTGAQFTGPGGVVYTQDIKPGVATVGPVGSASVIDVTPGSATVPAGGAIVVNGIGFEPGSRVRLKEAAVSSVEFVDSKTLIVRPATAVHMHGQEIEIEIPSTRQRFVYYSYQRTVPLGRSADPLIGAVEPAFPRQFWTSALVRFTPATANDALGFALQNEGTVPSQVSLTLVAGATAFGPISFTMPANARVARSLPEVFGSTCAAGCALRMTSSQPLHIFGLAGDRAADAVLPILPTADVVTVLDFATATNGAAFRTGDLFHVTGAFTPGIVPVTADGYVVLVTPSGEYWSLTPQGLQPGIRPLFRPTTIAAASTVDLLRLPLPPGAALGRYQWLSALAAPGTLNLITPIRVTAFDVVP